MRDIPKLEHQNIFTHYAQSRENRNVSAPTKLHSFRTLHTGPIG